MTERRMLGQRKAHVLLVLVIISMLLLPVFFSSEASAKGVYTEVRVGESIILTIPYQIKRFSVTVQEQTAESAGQGVKKEENREPKSPALVQVIYSVPASSEQPGKTEIKIDGQFPGKSTLIAWDRNEKKEFFDINVVNVMDTTELSTRIEEIAKSDAPDVQIKTIDNTIIVSGSVSTRYRRDRIDKVLKSIAYPVGTQEVTHLQNGSTITSEKNFGDANDKTKRYVNLLEVANAPQIDLQITVASIDRNALRELGINWAYASRNLTIDTAISSVSGGLTDIPKLLSGSKSGGLSTSGINGSNVGVVHSPSGTQFLVKALASKGLARVLAEPDLVVRDGDMGRFLAGGEFPVPVVQSSNIGGGTGNQTSITVFWKKFGVELNILPQLKENGKITLFMGDKEDSESQVASRDNNPDVNNGGIIVSSLDFSNAIELSGFKIPALKKDSINTNVELGEGETFVVAGLINEEWQKNLDKVPLLGDLPIIGAFFRDQKLTRNERELVFFVTPKLMKAMPVGTKPNVPGADEPTKEQDNAFRFIPLLPNSIAVDPTKLK